MVARLAYSATVFGLAQGYECFGPADCRASRVVVVTRGSGRATVAAVVEELSGNRRTTNAVYP